MSFEARLRQWIDTQGYPLEMRAAEALRASGAGWDHGRVYEDPETGKTREIDLVGYFDQVSVSVHVVFECKHSTDKPWVLFATDRSPITATGYAASMPATQPLQDELLSIVLEQEVRDLCFFSQPDKLGFNFIQARMTTSGQDNQDKGFQAVRTVTSACESLADHIGESGHRVLYVPVILIDAPLFMCHLPREGGEYVLNRVDTGALLHTFGPGEQIPVRVLSVDALPLFLADVGRDAAKLAHLHRVLAPQAVGPPDLG